MALLIPILAIVLGIGFGMLGFYLHYRNRKEIHELLHKERMAAIEKGLDVPPLPEALFGEDPRPQDPRRYLLKGLVWLFVGAGLIVALYANHKASEALFGLIPAGTGLAYLIYYLVEGRKTATETEAIPPPLESKAS